MNVKFFFNKITAAYGLFQNSFLNQMKGFKITYLKQSLSFFISWGILGSLFALLISYQNCSNMKFNYEPSFLTCENDQVLTINNACVSKENICDFNGRYLQIGDVINVCESELAAAGESCRCDNVTCTPGNKLVGPVTYKFPTCTSSNAPLNGICGASADAFFAEAPDKNLCDSGEFVGPTSQTPEGAWKWKCKSPSANGKDIECLSLPLPDIAKCGVANNQTYSSTPDDSLLCLKSNKIEKTPPFLGDWNWKCISRGDPNKFIECYAKVDLNKMDALCGPLSLDPKLSVPGNQCPNINLGSKMCSPGKVNDSSCKKNKENTQWEWTCEGINGGASSGPCSVKISSNLSLCGADNAGFLNAEPTQLCSNGELPSVPLKFENNVWTWSCKNETCTAYKKINGSCADLKGPLASIPPEKDLCKSGLPTKVDSTKNPMTWTCTGLQQGSPENCSVSISPPAECGADNGLNFDINSPPQQRCSSGTQETKFELNPNTNTWTWLCGNKPCMAYRKINGACVTYGTPQTQAPVNPNLCTSGTSSGATQNGNYYIWDCKGSQGGTNASCSVPTSPAVACGNTSSTYTEPPAANRCSDGSAGTPSQYYSYDDSWNWSCGNNQCKAFKIINGECKAYSGQTPPSALEMCSIGTSSCSAGGCWNWYCTGKNGGTNTPCSGIQTPPPFVCIDNQINLSTYLSQKYLIIAYYGLFFNRLPEQEGFNYWNTHISDFITFLYSDALTIQAIKDNYSPHYSKFEISKSDADLRNFISSIYYANFGTAPDQGGLDYWVIDAKNRIPTFAVLPVIFNSFIQTKCENQPNLDLKRTVTIRNLSFINALLLGEYFIKSKTIKTVQVYDQTYWQLRSWYLSIIFETSKNISALNTSQEMQTEASRILGKYKNTIYTWCKINCVGGGVPPP